MSDIPHPRLRGLDGNGGNRHAGPVGDSSQWVEFGRWLTEQREQRGLRRREAAKRAKLPEAQWRDLETGRKEAVGGFRLLPNPSHDVLERVAEVLELPVDDVLDRVGRIGAHSALAGRSADNGAGSADGAVLLAEMRRLSDRRSGRRRGGGRRPARNRPISVER
jgi:transcriptional regulator with XRE-family HTH domain